ncbi:hypothetical protein CTM55_04855 [Prevotella intermedia]|nr:hypothetical protein CTM55_04855 [Prevotella intermedia]
MHGKSGSFAVQKSRFRNAKSKLSFFGGIIFTKAVVSTCCLISLEVLGRLEFIGKRMDKSHPYLLLRIIKPLITSPL